MLENIVFEFAGLVALADFTVAAFRTTLTGTSSYMDVLLLVPGMYCQQSACDHSIRKINCNELPMVGSIATGYIFPLENPAIVSYLQSIGCTGHLVTVKVSLHPMHNTELSFTDRSMRSFFVTGIPATLLYLLGPTLTVVVVVFLGAIQDWQGIGVMATFMLSRLINVVVVRRRSKRWEVVRQFDVEDDLLVLLSQDRWFRLQGISDDLKIITSHQWREKSAAEGLAVSFARLLVYITVGLCPFVSTLGTLTIACLLLCSSALLGLCNFLMLCLQVFNYVVRVEGKPRRYQGKNAMANEMIDKSGRHSSH
ncbi:uncharacterized protein ARMOST_21332 [Armillaria ostoyae]|uniref:Uncharacterized protein n=1 Tax=Armillaria ostoyae TaxID=47428 RepID=A0A284S9T4_ARMOS|nr:uncharacterized protein ARMOST_21332 [Armillaria ostoyae]